MCDTNCSAMRPCGEPFCPYDAKEAKHLSTNAGNCVQSDKETPTSLAEQTQPVVVIPLAQWRRLVEIYSGWIPTHECDQTCPTCAEDREIKAIIASVEVPHD